jgi:hypothetical protein
MSLLTSSTYAGPDEPLWAVAGGGGGGGVASVTASGAGITATPTTGAVVVANTGVTSMVAGSGVSVSGPSGAVTVANTGVTSMVAGTGISLSGSSGAVTVTNTFASGVPTLSYQVITPPIFTTTPVGADVLKITLATNTLSGGGYNCFIWRAGWSANDVFTVSIINSPRTSGSSSLAGTLECAYSAAGPEDRVAIQFIPTVTGAVGTAEPVIWFIRYPGVVLP